MSYFSENYDEIKYSIFSGENGGLRRPQLGAIHSIAAHFTKKVNPKTIDPAIIVMPTGSGKTAVLIMCPFVLKVNKVLVITPIKLVRSQIANNYKNLEILRRIGYVGN